jgi:3-deoxy-7-phosphoheptulonate synthase
MGIARLVPPTAVASIAAGAHGLLIEVHPDPANALSDGAQSLDCEQFALLMQRLALVAEFVGRRLPQRVKPAAAKPNGQGNADGAVRSSKSGVKLA